MKNLGSKCPLETCGIDCCQREAVGLDPKLLQRASAHCKNRDRNLKMGERHHLR